MKINIFANPITRIYNKLSNFGKILLIISLLLIVVVFFRFINNYAGLREGYTNNDLDLIETNKFVFVKDLNVYDKFYAGIYDFLVFNNIKNDFEITQIANRTRPNTESKILDIGSGTGHHVAQLAKAGYNVTGIDSSPEMINISKTNYPQYNFVLGNALINDKFINESFTHILCLYFTIYFMPDKRIFFNNCMQWLKYGGYLVVHLVDRENFDPILPPGNPLYIVSPQKYAKERITKTKITFNDFVYSSNFELEPSKDIAIFHEKFKFNDGRVRKQEQTLYMEDMEEIINMAQDAGFILQAKVDLVQCAYENQYLFIFIKPS
jgi:SAM-dependent methyltransferase